MKARRVNRRTFGMNNIPEEEIVLHNDQSYGVMTVKEPKTILILFQ